MKDYDDFYLKCGVLLLADVFEKCRNNRLKNYRICQSHYFNTPGVSWDAMFKMKKLSLNLFQILVCTYSLRKVKEVEYLIFIIDSAKPAINI